MNERKYQLTLENVCFAKLYRVNKLIETHKNLNGVSKLTKQVTKKIILIETTRK